MITFTNETIVVVLAKAIRIITPDRNNHIMVSVVVAAVAEAEVLASQSSYLGASERMLDFFP